MAIIKRKDEDEDEDILIQGEEYEGEDDDDIDPDEDEDKSSTLNKKVIIFLAIGLMVAGIVIVVAISLFKGGNLSKKDDNVEGAANKFETMQQEQQEDEDIDIDALFADQNETSIQTGYTESDRSSLRGAGYTGPEIERFEKEEKPVDELLLKAKVEKDRFLQSRYKELDIEARKTEASDAYKELRDYTWLCGTPKELVYDETESYTTEIEKYNASYEKIPMRGSACLIKLTLDADKGYEPVFYNIHPERYAQLKDKGNMVVTYDVVTYNGEKYICNIQELNID